MSVVAVLAALQGLVSAANTEFLLPLPGESVQDSGGAILARAPEATSVEFLVAGASNLRLPATAQGGGLFSATVPRLAPGNWSLVLVARDSAGKVLSRDTTAFSARALEPTIASTIAGRAPAATATNSAAPVAASQSLFLAIDGGYRQGLSEGTLESWRPLRLRDGAYQTGEREVVLDREFTANATALWDYRRGPLRLRTRTAADLGDQDGQTQALHRASLDASWGPWLDMHLGDQSPAWSPLIMDGVRLRGVGVGLTGTHDGDPWGRVRYVAGWSRRSTDAAVQTYRDGTRDTVGAGYDRFVQAMHVGFGGGKNVLWGLTFLHAIDDTSGIDMKLQDTLGGARPRENAALETDLQLWFWQRRIELFGHLAATIVTDNLRLGAATSDKAKDAGLDQADFLSPVITVNSSTRGLTRLLADDLGPSEVTSFLADNAAARAGVRWTQPIEGQGRMANELRWVHSGTAYESFARGSALPAQSGVEFSHASNWAHDRVFLSTTAGYYLVPRAALDDADRTRLSASASIAPDDAVPGAYADGGTDWTNEPSGGRSDNWNAGMGLYQSFRPADDHTVTTSLGYSRSQSVSRADTSASVRTRFVQDSWNALVRWRLPAPVELRTGGQFLTNTTGLALPGSATRADLATIHGSVGTTVWMLGRKLETSLDAGLDHRSGDDVESGIRQWEQTSRLVWTLPSDQALRLNQRFVQIVDGRGDLRLDAGWEKYF